MREASIDDIFDAWNEDKDRLISEFDELKVRMNQIEKLKISDAFIDEVYKPNKEKEDTLPRIYREGDSVRIDVNGLQYFFRIKDVLEIINNTDEEGNWKEEKDSKDDEDRTN